MHSILITARASPKDEGYEKRTVSGVPLQDYFGKEGIDVRDLIASCHGNPVLMKERMSDLQSLAKHGYRIVIIDAGGLNLAKPSLEAAWADTTYARKVEGRYQFSPRPIGDSSQIAEPARFSIVVVPTDKAAAFSAPYVPDGVAAVPAVGINNYDTAFRIARTVMTEHSEGVYTHNAPKKMVEQLQQLKVPILAEATAGMRSGVIVGSVKRDQADLDFVDKAGSAAIVTSPSVEDPNNLDEISQWIDFTGKTEHTAWARGPKNVAFVAARAVMQTSRDHELIETIWDAMLQASAEKALETGYTKERIYG